MHLLKKLADFFDRTLSSILLLLVKAYRFFISPLLGPRCRFHPTCSEYAITALRTRGAVSGGYLILKRIIKCHPWHPGGLDPVEPKCSNTKPKLNPQTEI